jgi:hypothetical protein
MILSMRMTRRLWSVAAALVSVPAATAAMIPGGQDTQEAEIARLIRRLDNIYADGHATPRRRSSASAGLPCRP